MGCLRAKHDRNPDTDNLSAQNGTPRAYVHTPTKPSWDFQPLSSKLSVSRAFYEKLGAEKIGDHQSSIAGRTIPVLSMAV